jgi:type IV pilus assembly protein PilB
MAEDEQLPEIRIGELLVSAELVTSEDVREALEPQETSSERIVNILMSLGALNAEEFLEFLAGPDSYEKVDLEELEIAREVIELILADVARSHEVVPVSRAGTVLTRGMVCPLDVEMLEVETGLEVQPFICSSADLHACLDRYYSGEAEELTLTNLGAA